MAEIIIPYLVEAGLSKFVASVVFYTAAIVGLDYYIGSKTPDPKKPSLSQNRRLLHQVNPPRKIFYGRTKIAPSVVYAQNPEGEAGQIECYCVVADHPIETLHNIKINNQDFFRAFELQHIKRLMAEADARGGSSIVFRQSAYNEHYQDYRVETKFSSITLTTLAKDFEDFSDFRKNINQKVADAGNHTVIFELNWGFSAKGDFTDRIKNSQIFFEKPNGYANWDAVSMKFKGTSWFSFAILGTVIKTINTGKRRLFGPNIYQDVPKTIFSSIPNITLDVERSRDSLLLWDEDEKIPKEYTADNTSLCIYDYVKRYTSYKDNACGVERIDEDVAKLAAQISHEKKYKTNGVITLENSPSQVLSQLALANGSGANVDVNGVMHIKPGIYSTPVRHIIDKYDILDNSWSVAVNAPIEQRKGGFQVNYLDTNDVEQSVSVENKLSDNPTVVETDVVFINDIQQAKNIAHRQGRLIWDTDYISFQTTLDHLDLKPFDTIYLTINSLNIRKRYYRITGVEINESKLLTINARSETENFYNDIKGDEFYPVNPPTSGTTRGFLLINDQNDRLLIDNEGGRLLQ